MKITFAKQTVTVQSKYVCVCGHKFSRQSSDWFTINPFTTKTAEEYRKDMRERLSKEVKPCPKCRKICQPVSPLQPTQP